MSEILALAKIKLDGGTQMRSYIDSDVVSDYAAMMKDGDEFPALSVVYDGENYWLTNGYHRYNAALAAGLETFPCTVVPGTQADAQWDSYAANKLNGKQRTRNDVQRAIEAALLHPNGATMSDRQIAKHVGCSSPTIAPIRARLMAQGKIQGTTVRTGADGRKIETAGIGLKDQLANWHGLIFQPFLKAHPDADVVLIHQKGGPFLHITSRYGGIQRPILSDKYHLKYGHVSIPGTYQSMDCLLVDKGYVELFERDGLKVFIVEFEDLNKEMQSLAKRGFNAKKGYGAPELHTFTPVPSHLRVGDLTAKRGSAYEGVMVAEIVGRSESFVHVRKAGVTSDSIWFASELCAVEYAREPRKDQPVQNLTFAQTPLEAPTWIDQYHTVKRYYAGEGLVIVRSGVMASIAIGADALRLSQLVPGILVEADVVEHIFVALDHEPIEALYKDRIVVWEYESRSETLSKLWRLIVSQTQTTPNVMHREQVVATPEDERDQALRVIWNALAQIEAQMQTLELEDEDPLADAVIHLQTVVEIVGVELNVPEDGRQFEVL